MKNLKTGGLEPLNVEVTGKYPILETNKVPERTSQTLDSKSQYHTS